MADDPEKPTFDASSYCRIMIDPTDGSGERLRRLFANPLHSCVEMEPPSLRLASTEREWTFVRTALEDALKEPQSKEKKEKVPNAPRLTFNCYVTFANGLAVLSESVLSSLWYTDERRPGSVWLDPDFKESLHLRVRPTESNASGRTEVNHYYNWHLHSSSLRSEDFDQLSSTIKHATREHKRTMVSLTGNLTFICSNRTSNFLLHPFQVHSEWLNALFKIRSGNSIEYGSERDARFVNVGKDLKKLETLASVWKMKEQVKEKLVSIFSTCPPSYSILDEPIVLLEGFDKPPTLQFVPFSIDAAIPNKEINEKISASEEVLHSELFLPQ